MCEHLPVNQEFFFSFSNRFGPIQFWDVNLVMECFILTAPQKKSWSDCIKFCRLFTGHEVLEHLVLVRYRKIKTSNFWTRKTSHRNSWRKLGLSVKKKNLGKRHINLLFFFFRFFFFYSIRPIFYWIIIYPVDFELEGPNIQILWQFFDIRK